MINSENDSLGLAMDKFIKNARDAGFNENSLELIGCVICQDAVSKEYGGNEAAYLYFADLIKHGKTEQEILDLVFKNLI